MDDVLKKSVTAEDYSDQRRGLFWLLNAMPYNRTGLPAYWSPNRDYVLRNTLYTEYHDFWAGAIGIAITKMSSLAWEITGTQPRIRNYCQQLYLTADGNQSWVTFIARHLQDFLTTDNGAFVEIVRASGAAGARILGVVHLDSLRVTRTGDPDIPAIYRDLKGREHELKAHQVLMLADMPSSAETYRGVGLCAASRAWTAIRKLEAIEKYIYEKISGDRVLSLDLVKGIAPASIKSGVQAARDEREAKTGEAFSYMGSVVLPILDDAPLAHTRINFAELPDGFDRQKEFDIAVLQMANAIGLDVQDLQPLTGRALGSSMQSEVLEQKSKGKGLSAWRQQWTHLNNQFVLPNTVTFSFTENDLRDKRNKADVFAATAGAVQTTITTGMLTPAQGVQILADDGFVPKEFVPNDTTPQESIGDDEKPRAEIQAQDEAQPTDAAPTEPTMKQMRMDFYGALQDFREAMKK